MRKSRIERLADWAANRGLLPPWGPPIHHPIFAAFAPWGMVDGNTLVGYLGVRTEAEMLPSRRRASPTIESLPQLPAFDEEYFEWVDLLEAVATARDRFTMIEIGAGYARWAVRGWAAAQRRGLPAHVGIVEAEPQHALWAKSHLAFNGVPDCDVSFHEAAVGVQAGSTVFLVGMPHGAEGNNARDWYGQAVAWPGLTEGQDSGRSYCGKPVLELAAGWSGVHVNVQTLDTILSDFAHIDFADFDVQGAEADVIRASLGVLTEKVRRLHIGTHSREIDREIPRILAPAGWRCLRAYPCLRWNRTPFGWIYFGDGVQTWLNPRPD